MKLNKEVKYQKNKFQLLVYTLARDAITSKNQKYNFSCCLVTSLSCNEPSNSHLFSSAGIKLMNKNMQRREGLIIIFMIQFECAKVLLWGRQLTSVRKMGNRTERGESIARVEDCLGSVTTWVVSGQFVSLWCNAFWDRETFEAASGVHNINISLRQNH